MLSQTTISHSSFHQISPLEAQSETQYKRRQSSSQLLPTQLQTAPVHAEVPGPWNPVLKIRNRIRDDWQCWWKQDWEHQLSLWSCKDWRDHSNDFSTSFTSAVGNWKVHRTRVDCLKKNRPEKKKIIHYGSPDRQNTTFHKTRKH